MANVGNALNALGVTEWVLRGEPSNADEFGSMFRKVTGSTDDGTAIESDNAKDWGVTWDEVNKKLQDLTAAEPMKELRAERDKLIAVPSSVEPVTLRNIEPNSSAFDGSPLRTHSVTPRAFNAFPTFAIIFSPV
jgi:hypothetical protein